MPLLGKNKKQKVPKSVASASTLKKERKKLEKKSKVNLKWKKRNIKARVEINEINRRAKQKNS